MNQEKQERIKACVQDSASKPRRDRKNSKKASVGICQPPNSLFFIERITGTKVGKTRKIKSLVGELKLKAKQVQKLGLKPRSRLTPLLQKCCLRLSANESYQNAELEISYSFCSLRLS